MTKNEYLAMLSLPPAENEDDAAAQVAAALEFAGRLVEAHMPTGTNPIALALAGADAMATMQKLKVKS